MGVEKPSGEREFAELAELVLSRRASREERTKLAELLERDLRFRSEFLRLLDLERLLPLALRDEEESERFLESVRAGILAEQDGEVFLARARRRIASFSASRRRRRKVNWAAWTAAAAAILAALLLWPREGGEKGRATAPAEISESEPGLERVGPGEPLTGAALAHVGAVEGAVEHARPGSDRWSPAREGTGLLAGDRVRTASSFGRIDLVSGSTVFVGRFTALSLAEEKGPPGVRVDGGTVYVETVPSDRGFHVSTRHGRVVDLGTRFGVETGPAGTTVSVLEGMVKASTEAGGVALGSGNQVALAGRFEPPGPVRRAEDLVARFGWALGRVNRGLVALYLFKEGRGARIRDASGVGAPLDLVVQDPAGTRWLPGSLSVTSPTVVRSILPAAKIARACKSSGEISVEAWIGPANETQGGPARIVSLSADEHNRNFTVGQGRYGGSSTRCIARIRTTATDDNGTPEFATPEGALTPRLTHVVCTRSASGAARLYIDGADRASISLSAEGQLAGWEGAVGGDLSNWDESYSLILANEATGERPWLGEIHLVAVYSRALPRTEVARNFHAGPRAPALRAGLRGSR